MTIGEWVGRYSCPVCPKRFASLSDKKQHLKAEHPRLVVQVGAKR